MKPPTLSDTKKTYLGGGNESAKVEWGHVCILILLGLFSFTYNIHNSLIEGTEGLYAQITREMVDSGEYIRLTFQGGQYINKPPLYFWMVGGFTQLFGENESTLRMTGSLFCLGTMFLTFVLGKTLFSSKVGFWAAYVFATTHVFLWYGPRVLIDSTQTFFMTLALLGWVLGNKKEASPAWFLVAFLGMTLATMVKGLHGFALPLVLMIAYSLFQRDYYALKQWGFWGGFILFIASIYGYYLVLGPTFIWHFNLKTLPALAFNLPSIGNSTGSFKLPSYLYLIWFDFFPWSVLIPSSVYYLYTRRPFKDNPAALFILLWFLGYFLILCFSKFRREPYLMPIVPGFAIAIGAYLISLTSGIQISRWHRIIIGAAVATLSITITVLLLLGPTLLHRKWQVPSDLFPIPFIIGFVLLCGFLVMRTLQGQFDMMRRGLAGVGLCYACALFIFFLPAVNATSSPGTAYSKIKALAKEHPLPLYHYGITQGDLIFYLNTPPRIPKLDSYKQLAAQTKNSNILLVTDKKDAEILMKQNDLVITTLEEFPQPRKRNFLLLSIAAKSPPLN